MAEIGMPLCVHGEVTDPDVDIFDRESVFLDRVLQPLRRRLPDLRIVLEHVTTQDGVDFVRDERGNIAATITTHHLVINRNAILAGGIRPHIYCLPVAKRERHRIALVEAAVSGDPRFFLGTDSAPHLDCPKLQPCGCAGIFTAPVTLPILAEVFEAADALDRLEPSRPQRPRLLRPPRQRGPHHADQGRPWTPPASMPTEDGPRHRLRPRLPPPLAGREPA
jgi:dihydroorotase